MSDKAASKLERTCQNLPKPECRERFYDLKHDPSTCPICNTAYVIATSPWRNTRHSKTMETKKSMTCKIIAHTSNRYAATYRVHARGKVYDVCVEDRPGEDCTVHIDGVDEGSELFRAIEAVVLKDWLGIDAVR